MKPCGIQLWLFNQKWAPLQHLCHPEIFSSRRMPWGSFKSDTRTKSAACTHMRRRMGPHSVAIASMGDPKRSQTRDARTDSAGMGNHHRATVASMGSPRNPQWEERTKSAACPQKQAWPGAHCWVTVCSLNVFRTPEMRYTHQVRSLRTKKGLTAG